MSDMVESVARAIWLVGEDWDTKASFGAMPDYGQDFWRDRARAAVGAMRNHTLVYRENGQVVHELRGAPDDIWKTLIDAALEEPA
jgi:hypothetical protein